MGDGPITVCVKADRQGPAESDGCVRDVGGGDVRPDRACASRGVDQSVEEPLCGIGLFRPVGVVEQGMQDVDDTQAGVDGGVQIATQRLATVYRPEERSLARRDRPIQDVEDQSAQQVLSCREVAVQRGDPDAGAPRHGLTRRLASGLQHEFDGRAEQASPVASGVGPHGWIVGLLRLAHGRKTEYTPPLMDHDGPPSGAVQATYVPVTFDRCDHVRGPFFHGTKVEFAAGDLLTVGHPSNFHAGRISNHVYFAALMEAAIWGAELAVAYAGHAAEGHVYVVEPTGPFEDDPNVTNKKFPGNVTRSYRTRHPLRVVDEVDRWQPHSAEVLQGMLDGIARLRARGLDVIED